jgi:hypothetical protein
MILNNYHFKTKIWQIRKYRIYPVSSTDTPTSTGAIPFTVAPSPQHDGSTDAPGVSVEQTGYIRRRPHGKCGTWITYYSINTHLQPTATTLHAYKSESVSCIQHSGRPHPHTTRWRPPTHATRHVGRQESVQGAHDGQQWPTGTARNACWDGVVGFCWRRRRRLSKGEHCPSATNRECILRIYARTEKCYHLSYLLWTTRYWVFHSEFVCSTAYRGRHAAAVPDDCSSPLAHCVQ